MQWARHPLDCGEGFQKIHGHLDRWKRPPDTAALDGFQKAQSCPGKRDKELRADYRESGTLLRLRL